MLFLNLGEKESRAALHHLVSLRQQKVSCELYPDTVKLKKQMQYANDRNIPFVAILGEEEIQSNTITLKNMRTGEQQAIQSSQIVSFIQNIK